WGGEGGRRRASQCFFRWEKSKKRKTGGGGGDRGLRTRLYSVDEAVELAKKVAYAKFDETLELDMNLGVDPRKADQMVRGTIVLPHGLGKSKRVVVIASAGKGDEARDAGADEVGGDDIVNRIKSGWLDISA